MGGLDPTKLRGKDVELYAMQQQIKTQLAHPQGLGVRSVLPAEALASAYRRSGEITGEFAKTFYLGTQLMPPEKARAIWAVYVWCRRTDELVDGPNAARITPAAIDQWEERLEVGQRGGERERE